MQSNPNKIPPLRESIGNETLICGSFSKKEAAGFIADGVKHLHSSPFENRDIYKAMTSEALKTGLNPTYPWEQLGSPIELRLHASVDRHHQFLDLIQRSGHSIHRSVKEKLEAVLEELVSNALFHAYRNLDGSPRHLRKNQVILNNQEEILVQFFSNREGVLLSVCDQGGTFRFEDISKSFLRCYGEPGGQVETKDSGAGLGVYMSYELSTHLKIASLPSKKTLISCWIADRHNHNPDIFSFNFFNGGNKS